MKGKTFNDKCMKNLIKQLDDNRILFRDRQTGIAWVDDYFTGLGYSCHPNIDVTGSPEGMVNLGYWQKSDILVRSHGFIYNTSKLAVDGTFDSIAAKYCICPSCAAKKLT